MNAAGYGRCPRSFLKSHGSLGENLAAREPCLYISGMAQARVAQELSHLVKSGLLVDHRVSHVMASVQVLRSTDHRQFCWRAGREGLGNYVKVRRAFTIPGAGCWQTTATAPSPTFAPSPSRL